MRDALDLDPRPFARTLRALAASAALAVALLAPTGCAPVATTGGDAASTTDAAPSPDAPPPADDAASTADAAPADAPFETAAHNALPQVASLGGPSMHNVQLVLITYADDDLRDSVEAFGAWLGTSSWLMTVGADYGVGAGTVLGNARRTDNAPDTISSTQIEAMIAAGIADGSMPTPAGGDYSQTLYMVFFPQHTTITLATGGPTPQTSCRDFGGYHSEIRRTGAPHTAYAVVANCGTSRGGSSIAGAQIAASHEYLEAATDPFPLSHPAYRLPADGTNAWGIIGGELGDLCELTHSAYQTSEGYFVQRIWSNTAAAAGNDPCIPADTTRPYFNVNVEPSDVQTASAGDTVEFTLTGYSLVPMTDWSLSVVQQAGTLMMAPVLTVARLNNGRQSTLRFTVPDTARPGYAAYLINSVNMTTRNRQVWPVVVLIQ